VRQAIGRGGRPQGGWDGSSESSSGSAGLRPWGAASWEMFLLFRGWEAARVESAGGEGESPTVELVGLGGGEGQESNGLCGCLTVPEGERLLNRSKALESGSTPIRVELRWPETGSVDASLGVLCRRLRVGVGLSSWWLLGLPGGARD